MKAAIMVEQGKPLEIEDVFLLDRLDVGHILVNVEYSAICGSQIAEMDGVMGPDENLPHMMGHEGVGVVEDVGDGVRKVKRGDRVVLHAVEGKGIRSTPYVYKWNSPTGRKHLGSKDLTTFSEMTVASECRVTKIPGQFKHVRSAPLLGCPMLTALGCVEETLGGRLGESIIVFGMGGLGLCVIRMAVLRQMYPVMAIETNINKLPMAQKAGAHYVETEFPNASFDYAVCCTDYPEVLEDAFRSVNPGGMAVMMATPHYRESAYLNMMEIYKGKMVIGGYGGSISVDRDIQRLITMSDSLGLNDIVSDEIELDDINSGIRRLRDGEIMGRCIVRCLGELDLDLMFDSEE